MGKFPFAAFVGIVLTIFGGAATGYAASPLDGTGFASSTPNPDANSCIGGRILYSFGGPSTGPFAGTFSESGTILFGAGGAVTSWHGSFMITDTLGHVTVGTTDLAPGGTGTAFCTVTGLTAVASAASKSLTYTSGVGTGVADATVTYTADLSIGMATGSLAEHFGPTAVIGAGCDTDTTSQGNDQCIQV